MRLIFCIAILAGAEVASSAQTTERVLPVEVVAGNDRGSVWDFSNVLAEDAEGAVYHAYGDSIMSEEFDGFRTWYSTGAEGFMRAEGLLWRVDPDSAVTAGQWKPTAADCRDVFGASVVRESFPHSTTAGTFERMADKSGHLIMPGGDTISVRMSAEILTLGDYRRQVRRWFASADASECSFPVAVAVRSGIDGDMSAVRAFVAAGNDSLRSDDAIPDLGILDVSNDGRTLTVSSPTSFGVEVRIDVTDIAGLSYVGGVLTPGMQSVSIDISDLPRGTYLAVISAPSATTRKIRL